MPKVVILGGTGFLGYYTALAALKKGWEVASIAYPDIKLGDWFPKEDQK
jgi:nucleoside-diphosphate-sugar epimerase